MVRHFPEQSILVVAPVRVQTPVALAPDAKLAVEIVVIFVPLFAMQLIPVIVCDPLFVITIPELVTVVMSMYVDAHFVTSVDAFSTLAVLVLVKLVNHTLRMPPTATVKAIRRTVAIIALIPFISILY